MTGRRAGAGLPVILLLAVLSCSLPRLTGGGINASDLDPAETLYLVGGQPRTLDPALTRGGPDSPIGHVFSGLVTLDPQLRIQPDLAAGWTVSDDGRTYTFFLRRNALFHDGRPVTAGDVVSSWERATDPALGSDTAGTYLGDIVGVAEKMAGQATAIAGLSVTDDHTLTVTIDAPKAYFLAKLTYPVAYIVDRNNVAQSDWEHQPNGTGPFRLQAWRDDEILILARFDRYYGSPARIAHVVYRIGQGIPLSLYETDQIDLVGIFGASLARAQDPNDPLAADLRLTVDMCTTVIGLDTSRPPFDDVRVRQAFNYALDREQLIRTVFEGQALPARGALPPGMPGYTGLQGAPLPGYDYDPARARALLIEAGYARPEDGQVDPARFPTLRFVTSGYEDADGLVTAAATGWQRDLGVTVEVALLDPFIYYDELYAGRTGHLFSAGWCADYPDPENFLDTLYFTGSAHNLGAYSNPSLDAMMLAARSESDASARLRRYADIEARLVAEAPVVFVSHGQSAVLVKPRVLDYVLTPLGVAQWHRIGLDSAYPGPP